MVLLKTVSLGTLLYKHLSIAFIYMAVKSPEILWTDLFIEKDFYAAKWSVIMKIFRKRDNRNSMTEILKLLLLAFNFRAISFSDFVAQKLQSQINAKIYHLIDNDYLQYSLLRTPATWHIAVDYSYLVDKIAKVVFTLILFFY